jgi:hypothetical protein
MDGVRDRFFYIDIAVAVSLKVLDLDGRLEKRTFVAVDRSYEFQILRV